jgi:hypothetical protein
MRERVLLLLLPALAGVAIAPASASASAANLAATQTYVQANYAALRVVISHLAASEAAPLHVLAQVRRECPAAGSGSPQDPESTQMSDEVIGAMVISAAQPNLQAIRTFIRAAGGLSWSNRGLTRAIRTYVGDWKTILGLPAPNLCGDVRAWAAGGFHTLPASTVAFDAKFMPAWVGAGYLPAQLGGYENAATRALANRSLALEQTVSEAEARAVPHWGEIMNTLELWP